MRARLVSAILILATLSCVDRSKLGPTTGAIDFTITGLSGIPANVVLTGPGNYDHAVTASALVDELQPGVYTVTAGLVSSGLTTYSPTGGGSVNVTASSKAVAENISYALSSGELTVTITGMPNGANANVLVTGPGSFNQVLTATTTLGNLAPGSYTLKANVVNTGGQTYSGAPVTQNINVTIGTTPAAAAVTYTAPSIDLTVDAVELIQTTQNYTDTVPLVANKAGFLRVFVKSSLPNNATPKVRVRWYSSGTLTRTDTIPAPGASVPTVIIEATLNSSWNLAVPNTLIAKNLSILVDVDPGNLVAETNENNNCWPASCTAQPLDVRNVTTFHQMMVPVKIAKDGNLGNVTAGNMASFDAFTFKIHPVNVIQQSLHATYTTSDASDTLQTDDANNMWATTLVELTNLRFTEATTPLLDSTYYYGVVHPGYTSGVAGLGWVGVNQTAIGWDRGINDQILAHETGHNWGNSHAPGCGAAGVDPNYPRLDGMLDAFGFDPATNTLYDSASYWDVMSYCRPSWTSNYQYIRVMNFRASQPDIVGGGPGGDAAQPVMMVWGHILHGKLKLEPAFEVVTRPHMPTGGGSYTIEGTDESGGTVFRYAFEPTMIMDLRVMGEGFVFAIPTSQFDVSRLAHLRVAGPAGEATLDGGATVAAARVGGKEVEPTMARMVSGKRARVTWDPRYTMAMIRDAETGQVLSFARGNAMELEVPGPRLKIVLSDGVRSVTESMIAQ